jgi:dGTPase
VARNLGRALRLNEDLIEALALAHDIGHPPFGHAGEDVLDECLADDGGFNHNAQALRIFEELETRYHEFPGLNLSVEVLEGQFNRANKGAGLAALLEVQVVDAADSIAYDTHDADDALESGLLALEELLELPLWREAAARVRRRAAALTRDELRRAVLHELIDWQVSDLLEGTLQRLTEREIDTVADVRAAGPLIYPDADLAEKKAELERFLHQRVYRHPLVMSGRRQAQAALRTMFDGFVAQPELLPPWGRDRATRDGLRRATADHLAGMTDRFARQEFSRLFAR